MDTDFSRRQMVQQQIRTWDVLDPSVLAVLTRLHRERYVPDGFEKLAFADMEIPLPHGQMMMKPVVEGRLLQALDLEPQHSVLEIGTGTGFLTACLAKLSASVTTIDIFSDFISTAKSNLEDEQIENIELICMDATIELPEGQFDAVAVTGSLPTFDTRLVNIVKPGGRIFVIVGNPPTMDARIVTRISEYEWTIKSLFETDVLPFLNVSQPSRFFLDIANRMNPSEI
jgi:protein-L-isoaspartate(D-aspartate) O-methyltransferase